MEGIEKRFELIGKAAELLQGMPPIELNGAVFDPSQADSFFIDSVLGELRDIIVFLSEYPMRNGDVFFMQAVVVYRTLPFSDMATPEEVYVYTYSNDADAPGVIGYRYQVQDFSADLATLGSAWPINEDPIFDWQPFGHKMNAGVLTLNPNGSWSYR